MVAVGNIIIWHGDRLCLPGVWGVCPGKGRLSTKTKIVLSHFSLYVPVSRERGGGRIRRWEVGCRTDREREIQKFGQRERDVEWRRGSTDSFVCSLMQTIPAENWDTLLFLLFILSWLISPPCLPSVRLSVVTNSIKLSFFSNRSQHFTWCGGIFLASHLVGCGCVFMAWR